ncbi:MAG: DNA topoisomerase I [Candidatus Micrarchaeota archaeon]
MATKLIITEKPSVARKLADALGGKGAKTKMHGGVSYFEIPKNGDVLFIAPAVGHLYGLTQKKKGSGYPVFDIEWAPTSETEKASDYSKKYLTVLQKLIKQTDEVINACDFDVEGSLIGGNVIRLNAPKKPAKRMVFSTLTSSDLQAAYADLKPLDETTIEAGEARHFMDWMWGINNSRALMGAIKSAGMFKVMSIGRVQGPALALLAEREKEIQAFKSQPFWQLFAFVKGVPFEHERGKFFDEKEADSALKKTKKNGKVTGVNRKEFNQKPNPAFDLTSLQVEAYATLGLSPAETLRNAQTLYEDALISYPRTSSQKLSAKLGLDKIIHQLAEQPVFKKQAEKLIKEKRFTPFEGVKKDPAHPAIHPTGVKPDGKVPARSLKLYELIAKRFLACFGEDAVRETLNVELELGSEKFKAKGTTTKKEGWFELYKPFLKMKEEVIPDFALGESVVAEEIKKSKGETKPPKRYTPASIINALEKRNLGTKATRSTIIDTLFNRGYVAGKSIEVTPFGLKVFEALKKEMPEILDEKLTRHFEDEIQDIQDGKRKQKEVVGEAKETLKKLLTEFKKKEEAVGKDLLKAFDQTRRDASVLGPCNKCADGQLVVRKSKFGLFVGCNKYPDCRNTFPLPRQSAIVAQNKVCEKCKTPVVLVKRRGKRQFTMCLDPTCETKANWGKKSTEKKAHSPAA